MYKEKLYWIAPLMAATPRCSSAPWQNTPFFIVIAINLNQPCNFQILLELGCAKEM